MNNISAPTSFSCIAHRQESNGGFCSHCSPPKFGMTVEELQLFRTPMTVQEWEGAIVALKSAHGGGYPTDWYEHLLSFPRPW